jgi:hypothetical protein
MPGASIKRRLKGFGAVTLVRPKVKDYGLTPAALRGAGVAAQLG